MYGKNTKNGRKHTMMVEPCPCDSVVVDVISHEKVCTKCGAVRGVETDAPMLKPVSKILTARSSLGGKKVMLKNKAISGYTTRELNSLRMANKMNAVIEKMSFPSCVAETAARTFAKCRDAKKWIPIENLAVACVYYACRKCEILTSIGDVTKTAALPKRAVAKSYRRVVGIMGEAIPQQDSKRLIHRFGSDVGFGYKTINLALRIADVSSMEVIGIRPNVVAASALYVAGQIHKIYATEKTIGNISGTTPQSIRKAIIRIQKALDNHKDFA